MIIDAIRKVVEGANLSEQEARAAMGEIMEGQATHAQIAALLTALRIKGETVEELTGFARAMREKATPVRPKAKHLVDTCGTGGDKTKTFNISTAAAFVAAGAGVVIAKHGNRAVTGRCGSADVLEALGINPDLDLSPESMAECIDTVGIGFLFAPRLHRAIRHAMPVRREMGIRTTFNLLGPLANPAGAQAQLLGVFAPELTEKHARVLLALGSKRAFVVHGHDGLDEMSTVSPTRVSELNDGRVTSYDITPEQLGLPWASAQDLEGGLPEEMAHLLLALLQGRPGPQRDIVLLNAAAAIVLGDKAPDPKARPTCRLRAGLEAARQSIDSGAALHKLEGLRAFCRAAGEKPQSHEGDSR